jgi:predicted  nucleic acid-binding Zn-ribbon protein
MSTELPPQLTVYVQVRCLECGHVYGKPTAGGTTLSNPGCPACGYVGWISFRRHDPAEDVARRQAQ